MQIYQAKCKLKESSLDLLLCKTGNHYEFPSKYLQLLEKERIQKQIFHNLAIIFFKLHFINILLHLQIRMLLLNIKAIILANILVMEEDRVKLKQL